jgi:hypothetical protein
MGNYEEEINEGRGLKGRGHRKYTYTEKDKTVKREFERKIGHWKDQSGWTRCLPATLRSKCNPQLLAVLSVCIYFNTIVFRS